MPENVVNLLNAIEAIKGRTYVEGLVDMANLLAPNKPDGEDTETKEGKAS